MSKDDKTKSWQYKVNVILTKYIFVESSRTVFGSAYSAYWLSSAIYSICLSFLKKFELHTMCSFGAE